MKSRADAALFAAVFDTCDSAKVATLVTEDFEMFHDKGGRVASSGSQFVKDIAANVRTSENRGGLSRASRAGGGHTQVYRSTTTAPSRSPNIVSTTRAGQTRKTRRGRKLTHVWKKEPERLESWRVCEL